MIERIRVLISRRELAQARPPLQRANIAIVITQISAPIHAQQMESLPITTCLIIVFLLCVDFTDYDISYPSKGVFIKTPFESSPALVLDVAL
jgi:hypothetical protein